MTKVRPSLKKNQAPPAPKQSLATGFMILGGLVIYLIVAFIAPKSTEIIAVSKEFDPSENLPPSSSTPGKEASTAVMVGVPGLLPGSRNVVIPLNLDLTRGYVLSDQDQRVSSEFEIPEALRKATALWFDIYTKYTSKTWLILSDGPSSGIIEEWTPQKLALNLESPMDQGQIQNYLERRIEDLKKTRDLKSLRLQRGLREDFIEQLNQHRIWEATIDKIFTSQKLNPELAAIFFLPPNPDQKLNTPVWRTLRPWLVKRYLLQNNKINEAVSPIKVARTLATTLKANAHPNPQWEHYFKIDFQVEPAFYAALYASRYAQELQMKEPLHQSLTLKAFRLNQKTSIENLRKKLKVDAEVFFRNNPDILNQKKNMTLPKAFVIVTNL